MKQGLEGDKKGWSKEVHTDEGVKNVEGYRKVKRSNSRRKEITYA